METGFTQYDQGDCSLNKIKKALHINALFFFNKELNVSY